MKSSQLLSINPAPLSFSPSLVALQRILDVQYQGRSLQSFRKGSAIPLHENHVWLVYRGVVQISTLYPNGDESMLGLISPLMPFGEPISLIQPYSAIALSDVELMRINWQDVLKSPQLMECLFTQLTRRLQQTESLLAIASYRLVEDRLIEFLALLKREISSPVDGHYRLNIRLTHQHMANAIGTTRVTITRLLGQLRDRGMMDFDSSRHIILP